MQYLSLLQVTGDGKEWTFVNQETSIDLIFPSKNIPPISLSLEQLSCQLTDPLNKQVPCSITPTQPGVCTVMYKPTIRGPHQLSIKIKDTDIQGSPYRVNVLPEADSGVVQRTIIDVEQPRSVAVSKSGNLVVCHGKKNRQGFNFISIFNKKGEKKLSFNSSGECFCVAFTGDDKHFLAVDNSNCQIGKYTIEGRCVISVKCSVHSPSSIAVNPSGKVIVGCITCIKVLNPDLTHSHVFGVPGNGVTGNFGYPHVACDSNGVVYVAYNSCIRSYNIDGHCIGKYSYNFLEISCITGICIDSTNTMYVSAIHKNFMSVHSNSGKFIKCLDLDTFGNELASFAGIAVDNTTGVLYVCDYSNNCVISY